MNNWEEMKVGELGKVVTGKTPPTSRLELFGDEYPFITPTDIDGNCHTVMTQRFLSEKGRHFQNNLLLPESAVCFVCIGATIGKICITSRPSFTNQQINSIIVNTERHYPRFVYYLLQFEANRIKNIAGGAATPIVNKTAFSNVTVRVPSLEVEKRIGGTLSAYDDLIENNTRRIKSLEEMAQLLYREWFVHFRFPGYKTANLVDSSLGKIPQGWSAQNLFDVADVTYGFPFKSQLFSEKESGKKVIRIRDIPNSATRTFTTEEVDHKYIVLNGDLVVGMDGDFHIGKWTGGVAYLNQRVVRFRRKNRVPAYYLLLALKGPIEHFGSTIVGTTVAHLGDKHLRTVNLLVPDDEILNRLHDILDPMFQLEVDLRIKNNNLRRTRDLLMPKLISGEVNVEV